MKIIYKENKGGFIKPCPCSPGRLGCDYYIIAPGTGCPFNCSYCFLNFYSKSKDIILYSNTDKMYREFVAFIDNKKNKPLRFGTGEFIDSLAVKELDSVNLELAKIIKQRPNIVIEFKTKSSNIDTFLKIPAQDNIILSWSLNPQWIINEEEKGTASLEERLYAAKEIVAHGYSIALHLDPIFMTENTLDDYLELVDKTFSIIPAKSVKWLSMGGFRYVEDLKLAILENNNGKKWFLGEEYIKCEDGKFRYPKFLRLKFYNRIGEKIKQKGAIKTYLCMEGAQLWKDISWGDYSVLTNLHPLEIGKSYGSITGY
ncbi:MAG: radical SAM protein [Proteobacteria bacterium]|nr:radical SAM protein [Pseudomonadota bacterium]